MYSVDAVLAAPWVSVIDTLELIKKLQLASTAGRASGAFVVASLNLLMVVSVRLTLVKTSSDFGANVTASNVGSDSATAAFSERHAAVGSASRRAILTVSDVSGTVTAPARMTDKAFLSRSIHCAMRMSGTVK